MSTLDDERRDALRRTYLNLGAGELVAAAVFTVIALQGPIPALRDGDGRAALWSALLPVLAILVQAGAYWLPARGWVARRPMPTGLARLYRAFRLVDAALLVAGLVGVLRWAPAEPLAAVVVWAVWVFGAIEYVNYFLVRLAYPPSRWFRAVGQWRTPRLVLDMTHGEPARR